MNNNFSRDKENQPEIFSVTQDAKKWKFTRRQFLAAAGATATGLTLASCGDNRRKTTGEEGERLDACRNIDAHENDVTSLIFIGSDSRLISASVDWKLKVWDPEDGSLINTISPELGAVRSLAPSFKSLGFAAGYQDGSVRVFDSWSGVAYTARSNGITPGVSLNAVDEAEDDSDESESGIFAVAINNENTLLASAGEEKIILLRDLESGDLISEFVGHDAKVNALAFSPDGKILASASNDSTIKCWSVPDGEILTSFKAHRGAVNAVIFTPDGEWLISGGKDKKIKIWSLTEGEKVATLRSHSNDILCLAITPDGSILASGGKDNEIKLWSLPDGDLLSTLKGHRGDVMALAVNSNGSVLVSGGGDNAIKLWNLPSGEFTTCLVDITILPNDEEVNQYEIETEEGVISYTLPCGADIPAGAVCTCNCVAGLGCTCVGHTSCSCVGHSCSCDSHSSGGSSHYWHPN